MTGYPGFDCYACPPQAEFAWLRANTNLVWVGYYLAPAPSHQDTSWMGNQAWLGSGWGIAPLYVGEQVVGLNSSLNPSLAKGGTDGAQAAAYMASEGFAAGSCVYLDWEDGSALVQNASDYIGAWCDAVAAAGYQPGVYCSHLLAAGIHQLRSSARIWAFKVSTTQPHPFPGTNFPTLDPSGSGYAGASVWQLGQECQLALPGAPQAALVVDLSVGITADPGAP